MATKVPHPFINEYQKFEDWHFEKEALLKKQGENQFLLLKNSFSNWQYEYQEIIDKIGKMTYRYTIETQQEIKVYIKQSAIYKAYLETPYYKQIIEKPRGYAGDSEMMNIIYRNKFEGDTILSKFIHKLATECEACVAVRNRRALLTDQLRKRQGKILSFAAGPATEILDRIEKKEQSGLTTFLALDHDIETLRNVKNQDVSDNIEYGIINAFQLIKGKKQILIPRKKTLAFCRPKEDVKGLKKYFLPIKYKVKKLQSNTFDFIYCAGLYDYIQTFQEGDKGTTGLTSILFDLLKPGGCLIIGNFSDKNPIGIKWGMEFICDWKLIYRTAEEILSFAKGIPNYKINTISLLKESNNINYFLEITKKSA